MIKPFWWKVEGIRKQPRSRPQSRRLFEDMDHILDGAVKADEYRAGDDVMPDVHLVQVG